MNIYVKNESIISSIMNCYQMTRILIVESDRVLIIHRFILFCTSNTHSFPHKSNEKHNYSKRFVFHSKNILFNGNRYTIHHLSKEILYVCVSLFVFFELHQAYYNGINSQNTSWPFILEGLEQSLKCIEEVKVNDQYFSILTENDLYILNYLYLRIEDKYNCMITNSFLIHSTTSIIHSSHSHDQC